jgi:hypothetical protein
VASLLSSASALSHTLEQVAVEIPRKIAPREKFRSGADASANPTRSEACGASRASRRANSSATLRGSLRRLVPIV